VPRVVTNICSIGSEFREFRSFEHLNPSPYARHAYQTSGGMNLGLAGHVTPLSLNSLGSWAQGCSALRQLLLNRWNFVASQNFSAKLVVEPTEKISSYRALSVQVRTGYTSSILQNNSSNSLTPSSFRISPVIYTSFGIVQFRTCSKSWQECCKLFSLNLIFQRAALTKVLKSGMGDIRPLIQWKVINPVALLHSRHLATYPHNNP
jgi:hypothetical protein